MRISAVRLWWVFAVAVTTLCARPVFAQSDGGTIVGRVLDSTGAAVPAADVTVSGPALLHPRVVISSATGTYQVLRLPVGVYAVTGGAGGFRTVVRQGVIVTAGFTAQVDLELRLATIDQVLTVVGVPLVDAGGTGLRQTFTATELRQIPSARDPWVLLQQTPGIAMDRENIGGNTSGQQSNYVSRGASQFSTKWSVDGIDITDMTFTGASPAYFDFDAFEEVTISTAGMDVRQQTGGVGIALLTRSGSDRVAGSARLFDTDDRFASTNASDALRRGGATSGNPIQRIRDHGIELGGPLVRGRAWLWGSYANRDVRVGIINFYQPTDRCQAVAANPLAYALSDIHACLQTDRTTLRNTNLRSDVRIGNHTVTVANSTSRRVRGTRNASDLFPFETTWRDTPATSAFGATGWTVGPTPTYRIADRWLVSDRLLVEAQYGHVGNNFMLDFQDPSLADVQPSLEISTGLNGRSTFQTVALRPVNSVEWTATLFAPGRWGGDHQVTFGGRWRDAYSYNRAHRGGNATARFLNGVAAQGELTRDAEQRYQLTNTSLYIQDALTRGRWTVTGALRYDRHYDRALSSAVPANPILPAWLPAATFDGADPGVRFHDFSPRVGVNVDVSGDGRTRLLAHAARYFGQVGAGGIALSVNPLVQVTLRFPWADTNGDRFIQADELDTSRVLAFTGNYDPANPQFVGTTNRVDPGLRNDTTDEALVGVTRQIDRSWVVSATYIWRRYGRFKWNDRVGLDSDDYSPVTVQSAGCPSGASCPVVTYFAPRVPLPAQSVLTNAPGVSRRYHGLEMTARRSLARGWWLDGSLTIQSARMDFTGFPGSVFAAQETFSEDPTNRLFLDGSEYAYPSGGQGLDDVFVNARWLGKLSGGATLPWGIRLAGFYQARQGYPFARAIRVPARQNSAGGVDVLLGPMGLTRLPSYQNLDARLDRTWRARRVGITPSLDVFNVFNQATVLSMRRIQNAVNANAISAIAAPRVWRLGLSVQW